MAQFREDKFRTHRIIQIDKAIRNGGYPTVKKLMDDYGVSRRTIMRDIEFLRDRYEAPLEYSLERKGYYYTDPTFMIQNVLLTEGDLFTISTIMPLMKQYQNTPLANAFGSIMGKVSEMLPQTVSVDPCFLNDDVSFISDPLPEIEQEVFNDIFKAVKTHHVLQFEYKGNAHQNFQVRKVDCYRVLCQKGNWYVFCYDYDKKDYRVYALSRMKNIVFTGEQFTIPKDFNIDEHVDLSFGIWANKEPPVQYELHFGPELNTYIAEREWHKGQEMIQNDDGSVNLLFMSNQKQQILSWVLSFGSNVEVIQPEELKLAIKEEIKKMAGKY